MKICFRQSISAKQTTDEKEERHNTLMDNLEQTRRALEIAYAGFDNVTDPDLIDCYIFEVNSVLKRYKYLLEQVEAERLTVEERVLHAEPSAGALIG